VILPLLLVVYVQVVVIAPRAPLGLVHVHLENIIILVVQAQKLIATIVIMDIIVVVLPTLIPLAHA